MTVSSMPSASANRAWALGAEWYIGAVTSVCMPGVRPIAAKRRRGHVARLLGVMASRITPLGSPVVPEV